MNRRLSKAEVKSLRADAEGGIADEILARHYGISRRNVQYIRTGQTWQDEEDDGDPGDENDSWDDLQDLRAAR